MYLTPYQKKQIRFVLVLLLGIPATIFAVYKGIQYLSQATGDTSPENVVVSNVTTKSITISWNTQKEVEAYVVPILDGVEKSPVSDKRGAGKRSVHYVELSGLEPDTSYSFKLMSDAEEYESGSSGKYEFKTAPFSTETPVPSPVHGSVKGGNVEDVIVYVLFSNRTAYPVSTIVPSSGNWIVDLSAFRSVADKSLVKTTDDTELILMGRENSGRGYVLEGSYSSLFDSNGKLNQVYTFEIGDLPNIVSYVPTEALLGEVPTVIPAGDDDDDDETPPLTPPTPEPPVVDDDDTSYTGPYSIRSDVSWLDFGSSSSSFDLESGEGTVLITNLTDVGFTVVWRSQGKEEGYIKYGLSKEEIDNELRDYRDGLVSMNSYSTHLVESDRLEPDTTYYFEIYSGDEVYDNSGQKYSVKTLSTLASPPPFETKSGKILNATDPSDWVIVFKLIDNDESESLDSSKYVSTLADENGSWILTVGDIRTEDGDSYFSFSNSDILQAFFLGSDSKKFDFNLSQEDIELDINEVGTVSISSGVKLLSDYGIINLK